MRLSFTILFILGFVFCVSAQKTADLQWKTIVSKKGDLSISLPGDFLVYSYEKWTNLYWGNNDVNYSVRMESMSDAKRKLRPRQYDAGSETQGSKFISGDFEVIIYPASRNKSGFSIDMASSKGYYAISVALRTSDNQTANTILQSISVNGNHLMKRTIEALPIEAITVPITSLKTSQPIKDALKHKQTAKVEVKYDGELYNSKVSGKSGQEIFYSSPLIILRKKAASYPSGARNSFVQGTIRLSVLFKADGDIGEIIVLSADRTGLAESAVDAAKTIKFFPAHIDGKPVDSRKMMEYSFMIY